MRRVPNLTTARHGEREISNKLGGRFCVIYILRDVFAFMSVSESGLICLVFSFLRLKERFNVRRHILLRPLFVEGGVCVC